MARVAEKFAETNVERRQGKLFISMAGEAAGRLEKTGVKQIEVSSVCTYDDQRFFSARRDRLEPLTGMAAYLGLKNRA